MGISPSKLSTINSPSLSFLDRKQKSTSQSEANIQEKRKISSSSRSSSIIIKSKRLSLLSRHSKMAKQGMDNADHQDEIMGSGDCKEAMASSRRSSRRRTRSMARSSPDDVAGEDSSEPVTSRRIRRRLKGKSRLVEEDKTEMYAVASTSQIKGKEKETKVSDSDSFANDGEKEGQSNSISETMPSSILEEASQSSEVVVSRPLPPLLDAAPTLNESSVSTPIQENIPLPSQTVQPSIASHLPPSPQPNPFDLTTEERSRARAQIAQALGIGAATQLAASRSALSDQGQQPSMLSALLTDILGLRSGQSALSEGTPGSRTHGTSLGNRDITRSRTNGGTSVIVQGALISRTLPSHRSNASNNTASTTAGGQGIDNVPMQRLPSQPPSSATPVIDSSIQSEQELSAASDGDTQVATIEEQAAMLIRLLSIATAATAASLVSRPSQNRRQNSTDSVSSGTVTFPPPPANATLPVSSSISTPAMPAQMNGNAPATSTSTTSSNSSSWRQASQTYQILRERFSALRSRFRGQRVAAAAAAAGAQTEESIGDAANNAQQSDLRSADQGTIVAPTVSPENESRADEDATGSLNSLSSMLQDAIRDGVQNADRNSRSTERRSANNLNSSQGDQANSQSRSVHATLDAVRGGQLSRGEDGSFDRFLFDLMSDLDIAVRGLPRENGSSTEANEGSLDEVTRLRRERDMHDGQLSFFRLFTFPASAAATPPLSQATPSADASSNDLLPCVVVGVRSLESSRTLQGERSDAANDTTISSQTTQPSSGSEDNFLQEGHSRANVTASTENRLERGVSLHDGRPMSRFLLFVSGGHYPPQHPLFHSSTDEASRDLMVLMEFLGAMASMHAKPHTTVTKDQIEKSNLEKIIGGLDEISTCVKEGKVMENTSERCLICLEDWKVSFCSGFQSWVFSILPFSDF